MVGVMRVVFTPLAVLMALAACEEAAPPKPTMPSIPAESEPATPASGPGTTAAGGGQFPTGGGGGAPLPEVANNIVFEILAGSGPSRSGSIIALPPIGDTRQEAITGGTLVTARFPDGFTYSWNSTYKRHLWSRRQAASAITQDWISNGGTVVVSYSLDAGSTWLSSLGSSNVIHSYPVARWGRDESGGYVRLDLERSNVLTNFVIGAHPGGGYSSRSWRVEGHACTTTETSFSETWPMYVPVKPHHPTLKITEGAATATAEATLANGVITAVGNIQHGSGTFAGTSVDYSWGDFWGEPQRGSGATFTFTVTGGRVSAVAVDSGGIGYRKPCNPGESYGTSTAPPEGYFDTSQAGYWLTAAMKSDIRYYGSERILVRFAILTP